MTTKGKISLIGAGPGDIELITVKGVRILKEADVILYDALVNEGFLDYNPTAEKIYVGKRLGRHSKKQFEINQLIVQLAQQGKKVVRLKGGDVSVFARASEELEAAQLFGIETELIPGISSYSGIAAKHQIPLTKRGESESFWVITGHTAKGNASSDIALAAQSTATILILMGIKNLPSIINEFKKHKSDSYPIAIIQNGTMPNEKVVLADIEHIEQAVEETRISNPALIVIGPAASYAKTEHYSSFINKQLVS